MFICLFFARLLVREVGHVRGYSYPVSEKLNLSSFFEEEKCNNNNNNWFLYGAFLVYEILLKALYSVLLPRSLDSISILHSQCTFSTPWGVSESRLFVAVSDCQRVRPCIESNSLISSV